MGLSFGFDPMMSPFLKPSWLRAFGQQAKTAGDDTNDSSSAPPGRTAEAPRLTLVKSTDVEAPSPDSDRDE